MGTGDAFQTVKSLILGHTYTNKWPISGGGGGDGDDPGSHIHK